MLCRNITPDVRGYLPLSFYIGTARSKLQTWETRMGQQITHMSGIPWLLASGARFLIRLSKLLQVLQAYPWRSSAFHAPNIRVASDTVHEKSASERSWITYKQLYPNGVTSSSGIIAAFVAKKCYCGQGMGTLLDNSHKLPHAVTPCGFESLCAKQCRDNARVWDWKTLELGKWFRFATSDQYEITDWATRLQRGSFMTVQARHYLESCFLEGGNMP